MNWAFFLVRFVIIVGICSLFFFSQRFWHRAIWRSTANFRSQWLRVAARLLPRAAVDDNVDLADDVMPPRFRARLSDRHASGVVSSR